MARSERLDLNDPISTIGSDHKATSKTGNVFQAGVRSGGIKGSVPAIGVLELLIYDLASEPKPIRPPIFLGNSPSRSETFWSIAILYIYRGFAIFCLLPEKKRNGAGGAIADDNVIPAAAS